MKIMLKELFKKDTLTGKERKQIKNSERQKNATRNPSVPDGLFSKCDKCGEIICTDDIVENYYICPKCNNYFRIEPRKRISMLIDENTFTETDSNLTMYNPLEFPGYEDKLKSLKKKTNLDEAVVTGFGKICGIKTGIAVMSANFMMGSMGYNVGEKITKMIERATVEKLPVVILCCSGGARMQEGIVSLMQMEKTSQALKRHSNAGLRYISVLTDPTTGGVMASFAMLGDYILAEPGALAGFAGPRVIEQTIRQKLPEGFQSAEFLLEHGFVDMIVTRRKLRKTIAYLLGWTQ